jgi:hypothetical protein
MFEFLFEFFFVDVIHDSILKMGGYIHWCILSGIGKSKPAPPFKTYSRKKRREKDPSSQMSNGLIDGIIGYGIIVLIAFILVQAFD